MCQKSAMACKAVGPQTRVRFDHAEGYFIPKSGEMLHLGIYPRQAKVPDEAYSIPKAREKLHLGIHPLQAKDKDEALCMPKVEKKLHLGIHP